MYFLIHLLWAPLHFALILALPAGLIWLIWKIFKKK